MNELFYGGGMENQTLISLCTTCWRESLATHEFAHMWFGDLVTCRTWADIWLNEGFATWATVYWQEHKEGYESYKTFLIQKYAIPYLANNPGWAIADSAWMTNVPSVDTLFNTYITYEKGACMVHQLRFVLGDSVFMNVLKAYVTDSNLRYRSASIHDLMKVVNQVSGNNYDWFFDDWLFRPNHPRYHNTYDIIEKEVHSWDVRFRAEQTQADPPFFRMILPVRIVYADSTDTLFRVMNDQNDQLFTWTFLKQPVRLVFDPDTNIMLKEGTTTLGIREIQPGSSSLLLGQNTPNPDDNCTDIPYFIQAAGQVNLSILDITGKTIAEPLSEYKSAGNNIFRLDCTHYRSGVYFYRMKAGEYIQVKRMLIEH
jgi:aminopeptidase N